MKYLSIFMLFFSSSVFSVIYTLDIPLETKSITAEYSDISKKGMIRVTGCEVCTQASYNFDESIRITKQGKETSLNMLLKEQWDIKYPTIFLDKETQNIIRISY